MTQFLFVRASPNRMPAWDFDPTPALAWVATIVGLVVAFRWIRKPGATARIIGATLALIVLATNPITALRVNDLFRPDGPVTIDNWREHRELHRIADLADAVDATAESMPRQDRRFQCKGEDFVRSETLRIDRRGHVRYFTTNSPSDPPSHTIGWYYDEAGALRMVWDRGENRETFLDAHATPIWAWRHRIGAAGEYGLQVVNPEEATLRTTSDARARFAETPAGCTPLP